MASLTKEILSSDRMRELAARAIKERVDWIYGYSKYDTEEISSELRDRLHSMEYLGVAVSAILGSEKVDDSAKTSVARNYLRVIPLYLEGSLPKDVYALWGGMEPTCAVEAAIFLQERALFDWDDRELLKCVLQFASESSVNAKRDFLANLVARLNDDGSFLRDFSAGAFWQDEVAQELGKLSGKNQDPYGLDGIPEARRGVLVNLRPLLDADNAGSSLGPIANLSALTNQDLVEFFLGVGGLFFLIGRMNRVVMFKDMAETLLTGRGIRPLDLLVKLDERTDRDKFFYGDEARTKGLLKLVQERGEDTREFARIIEKFLGYKMETETRFQFFRFVYEQTKDRGVLDKGLKFKSSKIRSWASREMSRLPSN